MSRIKREPTKREGDDEFMRLAEQIAPDLIKGFEAWIKPELAKVVGWDTVNKIKDADFEAVFSTQCHMLSLKKSHTIHKNGATFFFTLRQGFPGKEVALSKWKYTINFDNSP